MATTSTMNDSNVCLTLTVGEIARLLGVSKSTAYTLVDQEYNDPKKFKVLRFGRAYRVTKESFYQYINGGVPLNAN